MSNFTPVSFQKPVPFLTYMCSYGCIGSAWFYFKSAPEEGGKHFVSLLTCWPKNRWKKRSTYIMHMAVLTNLGMMSELTGHIFNWSANNDWKRWFDVGLKTMFVQTVSWSLRAFWTSSMSIPPMLGRLSDIDSLSACKQQTESRPFACCTPCTISSGTLLVYLQRPGKWRTSFSFADHLNQARNLTLLHLRNPCRAPWHWQCSTLCCLVCWAIEIE